MEAYVSYVLPWVIAFCLVVNALHYKMVQDEKRLRKKRGRRAQWRSRWRS